MDRIDLHVHSLKSDGSDTPSELVSYAIQKGLSAFALTDHDTIDGIKEAKEAARKLNQLHGTNLEVIPGIELSTEYEGRDIHILGFYINTEDPAFLERLHHFIDGRNIRNEKMCRALQEGEGFDITFDKLKERFPDASITRAHYARYLMEHGYIKSMQEAFDRYIGDHCPYFIPREKITPVKACELILNAGGAPFLAHPVLYGLGKAALEKLVCELIDAGLAGIEAIYTTYTPSDEREIKELARKHHLMISGGSDYHGTNKVNTDLGTGRGNLVVPYDYLLPIKEFVNRK